jgi:hypothetical protein
VAALECALQSNHLEYVHSRRALCEATVGKVDLKQLDSAARIVRRQHVEALPPAVAAAAHFATRLCEEVLKANKSGSKGVGLSRDALWTKAVCAAADVAVSNGIGREQPPLTLAAALTFFVFERHTPKTAPSMKQVAESAGISEEDLMGAYCVDVLTNMEVVDSPHANPDHPAQWCYP